MEWQAWKNQDSRSAVGELNWIAVGVLTIAEAKLLTLPYFAECRTSRQQSFARGCDIGGVEDNLRTLAARGGWTGVKRDSCPACFKLSPALFIRDQLEV